MKIAGIAGLAFVIRPSTSLSCIVAVKLCAILLGGCSTYSLQQRQTFSIVIPDDIVEAETHLAAARRMETAAGESCVDEYYRGAMQAWQALESAYGECAPEDRRREAWRVYRESLLGLIESGQKFGRLDPRGRLVVVDERGRRTIPIAYYGFAWKPGEFCRLLAAEEFQTSDLKHYYYAQGLGAALVAVRQSRQEEPYYRLRHPFSATAVLRPCGSARRPFPSDLSVDNGNRPEAVLELYNPCLFDSIAACTTTFPLERDLTAPLAYVARESSRGYLEGFLDPREADVRPKLLMMEPYQRGKIPVVFIHGLLSDPTTWMDAANELRANPELARKYQFWTFRYPTGGALLDSAADLREKLQTVRETFDPAGEDAAMSRMVLVGHSMGGLVARLQVTYSYDILWNHAARRPLAEVRASPAVRRLLEKTFFFDPSPLVERVVFIGTPHRGSNMARRIVGRIASGLVDPFILDGSEYWRIMEQNQDIFFEYLHESPPTTIDLLEPSNPLLNALASMPVGRNVRLHTILGTGGLIGEPGDGVVPVSSARLAGVRSELQIPRRHQELHHSPETLAELTRILNEHAVDSSR